MVNAPVPTATLLLVDDDPSIIQASSRVLADMGRCRFARSALDALRLLETEAIDLVLLDAEMPGMGGMELLDRLRQDPTLSSVPVLLLTSHRDEATEEEAFVRGAVDFITKPIRPAILRARVGTQLRLKRALDRVQTLARTDALTGVANRRGVLERLSMEMARARREGKPLSLLMADVDHFKLYNDHYGHPAGDAALQAVAGCLTTAATRPADTAGRWGGEEFLLVLPATDAQGAAAVARSIHAALQEKGVVHTSGSDGRLTLSIGVAEYVPPPLGARGDTVAMVGDEPTASAAELIARADDALYQAKTAGRNRTVLAPTPDA